jgi:hypothetical protein
MAKKVEQNSNDIEKKYDVYMCYRRTGMTIARLLYSALRASGVSVFFDASELATGRFSHEIYEAIKQSRNMIVLMTQGALERCVNEGDWVRNELEIAISNNVNLVPVVPSGVSQYFPTDLPESLQAISYIQFATLELGELFEPSVQHIIRKLNGVELLETVGPAALENIESDPNAFSSPKEIFISYSRDDKKDVKKIKDELEASGFHCWMDLEGVESGSEFSVAIRQAIDVAQVMLFFLSDGSQTSQWARKEVQYAMDEKKHVVLIRFNDDDLTKDFHFNFGLSDIIDWRLPEQKEKLIRDLMKWRGRAMTVNETEKLSVRGTSTPAVEGNGHDPAETLFIRKVKRLKKNYGRIEEPEENRLRKVAEELGITVLRREELIEQVEDEFEAGR